MRSISFAILLSLAACHGSNSYGECVGIIEEGDPALRYRIDTWNTDSLERDFY